MSKLASIAALVFVLLGSLTLSAAAAPQSTRPDGSYQTAQNWNDRVCCKRGWQDWWTTRRSCARAGGHPTRNRDCRDDWNNQWDQRWWGWTGGNWDRRVCCKRGNRDWWTTARECRAAFGYQTANRECRDDRWDDRWDNRWRDWSDWDRRVCCKRGNRDWWTTARECRASFGYQTANRECRNDDYDNDYDDDGDDNRRVCCKRGNSDWWSTLGQCRDAGGYAVRNDECRNDY